ncbi:MAG: shikimate kinase, partial [Bacteroidota bacterium]
MLNIHRVYIIGFMGSGKSTAGKKLASLLGWSFIDLDKRIEEQAGKTIPEIFSQQGEDYFRNVEAEVLKNLMSQTNIVISTGGGTPCHGDNMDHMLETGLTLYLKLTPGQLKNRLSESTGKRPLIKDLDEDSLLSFIEEKLALREKWYNRAEITVEGINLDISLL